MDFTKNIIENLTEITPQRKLADVAKECDVVFARYRQGVKLPQRISERPLKAAIDFASNSEKKCLVITHCWFCIVPPRKTNLAGWLGALQMWEAARTASNNFEGL